MNLLKISKIGDEAVNGAFDLINTIIGSRVDSINDIRQAGYSLTETKLAREQHQ